MGRVALIGGTVLIHDHKDNITAEKLDVLIENDRIAVIADMVLVDDECVIIDCSNKIVSPGLISTHNHLWEVPLKGLCEDLKAGPYFATMFTAGLSLSPEDVFWGTLAGALEIIDAGTTTVLDFAHGNWTEDNAREAIAGTLSSGIRGVHAFSPAITLTQTTPTVEVADLIPTWFTPTLESLATSNPLNSKQFRLQLGLGFDYFFLDQDTIKGVFEKARSLGIDIFTSHGARTLGGDDKGLPQILKEYDLLCPGYVISHMTGATREDIEILSEAGAHISASPTMELAMGMGTPVCFRKDVPDIDTVCSLGTDCLYGNVVNEMRAGLHAARANDLGSDRIHTCQEAFNMDTIMGARAMRLENEIGSIAVGKKADLVVWDAVSPAMLAAAQRDPVRAIVMHSSVADVHTVIVDGIIRKRDGKLTSFKPYKWQGEEKRFVETDTVLSWKDVVQPVLTAQKKITAKWPDVDFDLLEGYVKNLYGM